MVNLCYIFFAFAAQGSIYDKKKHSPGLEIARIFIFLGIHHYLPLLSPSQHTDFVFYVQYFDILVWPFIAIYIYNLKFEDLDTCIDYNNIESKDKIPNGKLQNSKIQNGHISNGSVKHKSKVH